jgi:hypothetical protein
VWIAAKEKLAPTATVRKFWDEMVVHFNGWVKRCHF